MLIIMVSLKLYVPVPFMGAILDLYDFADADSTLEPYLKFFGSILYIYMLAKDKKKN
jgi:hypothetical protein